MQVIVKYSAVMYIVDRDGPLVNSVYSDESLCRKYPYGVCVMLANFHNQLIWN